MSKIAVIYWSATGNTETMANAVIEGIKEAGAEAELFTVTSLTAQEAAKFDKLALGCPACGSESLDDNDFEPFFAELEKNLAGKTVALFGSYSWGDGQWLRDWQERVEQAGATIVNGEGVKAQETPTDDDIAACKALGKAIAS